MLGDFNLDSTTPDRTGEDAAHDQYTATEATAPHPVKERPKPIRTLQKVITSFVGKLKGMGQTAWRSPDSSPPTPPPNNIPLPKNTTPKDDPLAPTKPKEHVNIRAKPGSTSGVLKWFTPIARDSVEYLEQVERENEAFRARQEEVQRQEAREEARKAQKKRDDAAERKCKQRMRNVEAEIDEGIRDGNGKKKVAIEIIR